ncbi:tetratricopeptide repeat protein [Lysobacter sp. F60174L2]|uniref:tetratricopeptide repeat protein n=1 Tax=Lysobacter sp. F60174L2 TaxID=3459295 RepID=UPI00403D6579
MIRTLLILLLACSGSVHAQHVVHRATPSPAAQVRMDTEVPDELRHAVDALELDRSGIPRLDRVRRLFEFMVAEDGLALRYQEHPTYGVAESYARRRVNCLSFTMMFIALARTAGVDAYAQASEDALAMRMTDNTLVRANHVKAGIDIEGAQYTVDVGWRSVVVERHPERISDIALVAQLHNNNAVERLAQGDHAQATAEIATAIALDPASATIWSNAGVIHWRSGRHDPAEQAYLRALELEPDHIAALGNLVGMYRATGATRQADRYDARLQRAQASDPFSQFLMAQEFMAQGAYEVAASHYRRAIRLLPNQPKFHYSLADAYRKLGKDRAARRTLDHALSLEQRRYSQRSIPEAAPGAG